MILRTCLDVVFLLENGTSKELAVDPNWRNTAGVGFSDPLPLRLVLRNSGKAATNVEVYMRYFGGAIRIEDSVGKSIPRAVVSQVQDTYEGDCVSYYAIARAEDSPLPHLFEEKLQLRCRYRDVMGMAVMEKGCPSIDRGYFDFTHATASELGLFPIDYIIKYSESDIPVTGKIYIRVNESTLAILKEGRDSALRRALKLVNEETLDDRGFATDRPQRRVKMFSLGATSSPVFAELSDVQLLSEKVLVMRTSEGDIYVEKDRDSDGFVDDVYISKAKPSNLFYHLVPESPLEYIPVQFIVDADMNGITSIVNNRVIRGE